MDIEGGRGVGGWMGLACLIYDKNPRRPRTTDAIVLTWINDPMRVEFSRDIHNLDYVPKGRPDVRIRADSCCALYLLADSF